MAERYDTNPSVNLVGFRSQLQASYVSSPTEELWFNETVYLWMIIDTPNRGTEYSGEGINGCRSRNAILFEWIEHSGIQQNVNKRKLLDNDL